MKVWTSYYGSKGPLPPGTIGVAVSRSVPEWAEWKAQEIVTLAAPKDLGSLYWAENYRRQMSRDRLGEVYAQLLEIEKRTGREPVLLCYEKDANNCHRTILWNMLRDEFGVEGGELGQVGLGL